MKVRRRQIYAPALDVGMGTRTGFAQLKRWLGKRTNVEVYREAFDLLAVCVPRCVEFRSQEGSVLERVPSREPLPKDWVPPLVREWTPLYYPGRGRVLTLGPADSVRLLDTQRLLGERTGAKVLRIALDWLQRCARAVIRGQRVYLIHSDGHEEEICLGRRASGSHDRPQS